MRTGFAGLGLMGRPMAENLLRAGTPLSVYNRSPDTALALQAMGAEVAATPADLFAACDVVILMLANDEAVDAVLGRNGTGFAVPLAGRLVVNMGTHAPDYSRTLAHDIARAGGRFVEAPVSGSRGPAQAGRLVAMLAGPADAVAQVRALIAPMCQEMVEAGAVPAAMAMKLAVNLYLISTVTALAEATTLAKASGLDLAVFGQVIANGPLGSSVAQVKLDKMARRDFEPQAAIRDVVKNARLVARAALAAGSQAPLLGESLTRFEAVLASGAGDLDMSAVLTTYE